MKHERYVYAQLPRTGLCNMLFPWARAELYARDHSLKILAPQWVKLFRVGPWLRGEMDKRYYFKQFTNRGYINGIERWFALHFEQSSIVYFRGMGNWFADICGEQKFLASALRKIASDTILRVVDSLPEKYVGIHVRRGDFSTLGLSKPIEYYIKGLHRAREIAGENLPALVFSDGRNEELGDLLQEDFVSIMPAGPALQDMLSLSKSTIIVGTDNSTFSGWAAFLGQMPNIWMSKDGHSNIGLGTSYYV